MASRAESDTLDACNNTFGFRSTNNASFGHKEQLPCLAFAGFLGTCCLYTPTFQWHSFVSSHQLSCDAMAGSTIPGATMVQKHGPRRSRNHPDC